MSGFDAFQAGKSALRLTLGCGPRSFQLAAPAVMGILNVTPDSFSDGGRFWSGNHVALDGVLYRAAEMIAHGVDILDVGGESTRPGSAPVSLQEEMDRVLPVVEALAWRFEVPISVDTSCAPVMRDALSRGAVMINDVRALRRPGALDAVADAGATVCLMHMQGEPQFMQQAPSYADVVQDVLEFLLQRAEVCIGCGVAPDRIIIDPGFGFGKSLGQNLAIFRHLPEFVATGFPVLVGVSRKSMIGGITGRAVDGRLAGSLALAALAVSQGVAIVRVHDVAQTRDAVDVISAVFKETTE